MVLLGAIPCLIPCISSICLRLVFSLLVFEGNLSLLDMFFFFPGVEKPMDEKSNRSQVVFAWTGLGQADRPQGQGQGRVPCLLDLPSARQHAKTDRCRSVQSKNPVFLLFNSRGGLVEDVFFFFFFFRGGCFSFFSHAVGMSLGVLGLQSSALGLASIRCSGSRINRSHKLKHKTNPR